MKTVPFFLLLLLCGCAVIDDLPVRQAFIEQNDYNRAYKTPDGVNLVRTITIHNTAEQLSARQERERVNNRRDNVHAAFHFAVDENEALQLLPLNRRAWHTGDGAEGEGNAHSIGIEICRSQCYGSKEELYRRAEANAVILAARLLDFYNLPVDALKKHQDWSGKYCPHRILQEGRWEEFKAAVASQMRSVHRPVENTSEVVYIGNSGYKTFSGGSFADLSALLTDLNAREIKSIDVSSWKRDAVEESYALLKTFRDAGFTVNSFYILIPGEKDYLRQDIVRSPREYQEYLLLEKLE